MIHREEFEVGIVGGGAAGLSAAIWLGRYLHDVVVIDSGDPRNWETRGVRGYLGCPGIRPAELRGRGRAECRGYGVTLIDDHVEQAATLGEGHFELVTDGGVDVIVRRLLIAIGVEDNWPYIPGLDRLYGATVHTCPNCDGYESRGTRAVVIGAGRKAAGVAMALLTWTQDVLICTNGSAPEYGPTIAAKLETVGIPTVTDRIVRLDSQGSELRAIGFEGRGAIHCEHIYIALGQHPSDDIGDMLGCERNEAGLIIVDDKHRTSVEFIYAAGDITPGPQLAIRAAAQGAEAAMAIHKSLVPLQRKL